MMLAALVTFSPFMVWYSQEARGYALLAFLGALSFLFFLHVLSEPRARWLAGWAIFSVLAIATHYYAVPFVAMEAAWLLVSLRAARGALAAVAATAVAGIALLPLALAQIDRGLVDWLEPLKLRPRLRETLGWFLGGPYLGLHQPLTPLITLLWAFEALLVAGAIWLLLTRSSRRERAAAGLAAGIGAGTLAVALFLALAGQDYVLGRYLIVAWLPLAAAAAVAFAIPSAARLGIAVTAVTCGLWLAVFMVTATSPRFQRDDWRLAAETLGEPRGRARSSSWGRRAQSGSLRFYLPGARNFHGRTAEVEEVAIVDMRRSPWARPPTPPSATARVQRIGDRNVLISRFLMAGSTPMVVTDRPELASPDTVAVRPGSPANSCPCARVLLIQRPTRLSFADPVAAAPTPAARWRADWLS